VARARQDGQVTQLPAVCAGATWQRVDVHLHSPGAHSFVLPGGTDLLSPAGRAAAVEQYVARLVAAGVDVGVLTDYQGVHADWFVPIRDRAAREGITVLPGAELSVDVGKGLHLLLVCDPETDPEEITDAIRHLDSDGRRLFTDREPPVEVRLRGSLPQALADVRRRLGCLVIAAHAEDTKGIFRAVKTELIAQLWAEGLLDAFDKCDGAQRKLQGTGFLSADQLARIACVRGSDPKRMEDIGTRTLPGGELRATWIKLSSASTSALRLALRDPSTRVLARPPHPPRHPRILSIEVEGGFLNGTAIRFSDDLTTLIGGRGVGKSAVLETLRYGLDAKPYSDHTERLSLVGHALGSGGRVRLVVERPGAHQQRYEIIRVFEQRPRVTDLSTGAVVEVPPMELFGSGGSPVILLQREIQSVARDGSFRRRLLDEVIGDRARQADSRVRRLIEEIKRNAREIEGIEEQLDTRSDYVDRLNRLRTEIAYFDGQGLAEKYDRFGTVASDEARLATASRVARDALASHQRAVASVRDGLQAMVAELRGAESEHADQLLAVARTVRNRLAAVEEAYSGASGALDEVRDVIAGTMARWPDLTAALHEDLRRAQTDLKAPSGGTLDSQRYVTAVRERTALEPIVEELNKLDGRRQELRAARETLVGRLQEGRRAAFLLRQRAAESVNERLAGKLRMEVAYLGDTTGFRQELTAVLRGSRVSADAIDQIASRPATDGAELARCVGQGVAALEQRFTLTYATAQRLHAWLTSAPDRLRAVETLAPDDQVRMGLTMDGTVRDLSLLSGGQKATALLLLLFAQGGRPLVLDQPEDDLDNQFVYEDVVELLRREKGVTDEDRRRQIIVATHNANIPVNGDAELVLSLSDVEGRCQIHTRASIDDPSVRREIRTVLEGGEEAFRRRAEKYGELDDT
jgi:chromosome segregation protein